MEAIVTAAGGFIGGHLTKRLIEYGYDVIAVDRKPLHSWYQEHDDAINIPEFDLSEYDACHDLLRYRAGSWVFNLASDMGGVGFLEKNKATCMLSSLTNTHLLMAARRNNIGRYFFSSSAAVYPVGLQSSDEIILLKEEMAYPADCEDGYGWEKLFGERMCRHFTEDFGLETL